MQRMLVWMAAMLLVLEKTLEVQDLHVLPATHAVMDISCSTCYTVNDFLKTERTRGESGFLALAKT